MGNGAVWVIGASGGLGRGVADAYLRKGYRVISGARSFTGENAGGGNETRLYLDVTSAESCREFAARAISVCPEIGMLAYCAGLLVLGPCEETADTEYSSVMDVNFIGMTRMVSLALPHMRRAGSGRIVLLSSLNGLLGIPFQSAYVAAKHAMEGYAECLRMELAPFNVGVTVAEPGDHRGGSAKYRLRAEASGGDSPYKAGYQSAVAKIEHDEKNGLPPEALGDKVVSAAERGRNRVIVAKPEQRLSVLLHGILPVGLMAGILRGYYGGRGR